MAVAGSAALILGPLLRPGYVLAYDMVFTPRMPIGANSFGLGSQLPRAVPSDLVVAAAGHLLPGDVVQKLVLVTLVVGAGIGAARLTAPTVVTRTAAALAYIWTPYLGERLLLGQWAVLVGYAGLPWLIVAARRARLADRDGRVAAWARFVVVLGVMSLGGAPAWLLALFTAPVVLGWGDRRHARDAALRVLAGCGALVVFALPWVVPALSRPGGVGADVTGAEVFAPRADTPFGPVLSVLTGGGVWNAETVPPGRDAWLPAAGALVLLALGVVGTVRRRRDPVVGALAIAALPGVLLALLTCWPPGARFVGGIPIAAELRDAQRLLAPWVLLLALGVAAFCGDLVERAGRTTRPAAALLVVLPVAVLPTLAWGISGHLAVVDYPGDFAQVRARLDADHRPGAVVVLPFEAYRRFAWNHDRTSLDPLNRWLDRTVIASSDLPVARSGNRVLVVRGEDRLAARVANAATAARAGGPAFARAIGRDGTRWVVVDAAVDRVLLSGLLLHYRGSDLRLYEVPARWVKGADDPLAGFAASAPAVVSADLVAVGLLITAGVVTTGLWTGAALRKRG